MNALTTITRSAVISSPHRQRIRSYTPAEARALEDHYIACARIAGLVGGGKAPCRSKQEAAYKRDSSKVSALLQSRIVGLLHGIAKDGASIRELATLTGASKNAVMHATRRLVEDGRAERQDGKGRMPSIYHPVSRDKPTMQREAGE